MAMRREAGAWRVPEPVSLAGRAALASGSEWRTAQEPSLFCATTLEPGIGRYYVSVAPYLGCSLQQPVHH